ncbi:uncharacterized protein EV422DRAFT_480015, partial [Fimicolochytrium jonesii]|uniref:uncharacterized protein n=1 Tax=Fimicolochytrium jonesii TaxID=1396493 RepID=UPI0022FE6D5A
KPPYPYVELISYAINSHPSQKMALSEIYNWLLVHFPWFQTATSNWRNSVRHNLSLNKKFVRVPREAADGVGKGDLWTVE